LQYTDPTLEDIRLVIMHQANIRIMETAAGELGLGRRRLWVDLDRYGNTSAGRIPLALDEAHRAGHVEPGDKVLVCGFGAGLAWGTAIVQW
jgi:3-oxoacyl-[acyl-carrier-protein] synthase-3